MRLQAALEADAQFAESCKPGMRALDYPAVAPQSFAALYPPAGNASLNPTALQIAPAALKVIALVRMQLVRALSRSAAQARYRDQRIERGLECHRVVAVSTCHRQGQRDALGIYDEMALAAEFASVCRVRARLLAPRGLATLALSMLARLQSMQSCSRSLLSMA